MASEFTLERVYNAPREKIFDAFSSADHLCNWWGSLPFDLIVCELDFQVTGRFFYGLISSQHTFYGVFDYLEIEEASKIVFVNYFADSSGNPIRHPMNPSWPMKMLNSYSFESTEDEKTMFKITSVPWEATEEEIKVFEEGFSLLKAGFKGTLDKLELYLETME